MEVRLANAVGPNLPGRSTEWIRWDESHLERLADVRVGFAGCIDAPEWIPSGGVAARWYGPTRDGDGWLHLVLNASRRG